MVGPNLRFFVFLVCPIYSLRTPTQPLCSNCQLLFSNIRHVVEVNRPERSQASPRLHGFNVGCVLSAGANISWPCADFFHSYILYFLSLHNHLRIPQSDKLLRLCIVIEGLAWKRAIWPRFPVCHGVSHIWCGIARRLSASVTPERFHQTLWEPTWVIMLIAEEYSRIDISLSSLAVIVKRQWSRWIPLILNVCCCRCYFFPSSSLFIFRPYWFYASSLSQLHSDCNRWHLLYAR